MKARVDDDLCIGCGPCEEICPDIFHIVDGLAVVQVEVVPPELEDSCRDAADNCPANAIIIEE